MEAQVGHPELLLQQPPGLGEGIGATFIVLSRFTEEHQIAVFGANGVLQCGPECFGCQLGKGNGASTVVLGVCEPHHALLQVYLMAT